MQKIKPNTIDESWIDSDDGPDWETGDFDRAEELNGDVLLREASGVLKRGRPKLDNPKIRVTLRLDADLIGKLREAGPGWQTRANVLLRKAVGV